MGTSFTARQLVGALVAALPLALLSLKPAPMSWTLGIATYFIIWWTVLFAVLPFGVRTQDEAGDIVPGTPASAPATPRMKRVFLWTTVVAAVVFAAVWMVIRLRLLPLAVVGAPGG